MPSHHYDMQALGPSGFHAEAPEPQGTAAAIAEERSPTERDQSDAVTVSPNEGTGIVGSIRQYFRLRHGRHNGFTSRHVSLVQQHFGSAGRHAGLGLRQQIREFASRQVDRYRRQRSRRRERSRFGNLLASRQARNRQQNIEDHNSQHAHPLTMLENSPLQNYSELRRFENLLASRPARNNQQNIEDLNFQNGYGWLILEFPLQHAHGSAMSEAFPLQDDEIEGHILSRRLPQMPRAASPVRSHSSNISYFTDNSDYDPPSDGDSEVRRGRSLRRAGSNFSDAFSEGRGPSRDHSEEWRGRSLV
ncbi:hypothetical protein N7471_010256 [Penicillium samsonianum]|uniref:uncharacterized protein n=1 Tax=Penicillium samsonianum TaxID=1882272 RepID=UPI002547A17A|nr:uncharacterized protein N7471_010256 [Penicillium samsonianum]KAJ6129039.1 hypothetical protein N7471_010256 [Penicillium samsonianum]